MPAAGTIRGMTRTPNIGNLRLRAALLAAIRDFFSATDYLEVETPLRIPAPIPEAHIDPVVSGSWFLQPSPEICMKRLLSAGISRLYQICKCFRSSERGRRHLPEFTMLEWYAAGQDYHRMMDQTEALIGFIAGRTLTAGRLHYQGRTVDLNAPWPRWTVRDVFRRYAQTTPGAAIATGRFDELMAAVIEPQLGLDRPVFVMDYPAACGSLAKRDPHNPRIAQRFELYIAGVELCNGFSELTDPTEQRNRFTTEQAHRKAMGRSPAPVPEPFLTDLAAMPDAAGNALGLDRLVMLFADTADIDDVVAFPPEYL
jgi:lysyl-tRNA synthetase class 2